jgi:hypothetical protein
MNKIEKQKEELSQTYHTSTSSIVWIGNNKFIVRLEDGKEIRI